ncbi:MAG: hypothetical protein LBF37_01890 [Rickettsiales bacterium]|nr:hypothetical protein [Rickettsiales bacterium]
MGTVIDRLGSLVVEKLLKNKKEDRCWLSRMLQMTWKDYGHFQYAEKENDCIKILTREYTYSRNLFTALLILTCLGVACGNSFFCKVTIFGCLLFYLSMRKHANKIAQRVDFTNKKRQGGNP